MDRLRELRGTDTRERDLANILGFEHSRAVRWKEGQMYVDRAEYLVRLADALDVDTMLLVNLASGGATLEQAQRQLQRAGRATGDDTKKRKGAGGAIPPSRAQDRTTDRTADRTTDRTTDRTGERHLDADLAADTGQLATDAFRLEGASRGVVLLITANGEGRSEFSEVVGRHADVGGLVATGLSAGVALAERYRPELTFLDLGLASTHAFDAIRVISALSTRAGRRCRVVAGTSSVTDVIEKPALMAGASHVTLLPFGDHLFATELDRLEERLGPRKPPKK
jgi:CheY-like chemotaxis protein